jgi:peptide/nickel transport system substrate-binding protein
MRERRKLGLAALAAAGALVLAACGGSSGGSSGTSTNSSSASFNMAISGVVNPSTHKGGTLTFGNSSTPDSTDPGNTYYANMWNFTRLYAMPLMTYKSCPGSCGLQVVPDLATSPGQVSADGLTWTYHIQSGVKYEDGTTVTSQDVKYAVERTYDRATFPLGPSYFPLLLKDPTYPGPYKDKTPGHMGLTSVTTPDSTTIVFHLAKPFADFDYVTAIPQTAPVPQSKDTGAKYQLHPLSTGPYKFQSYTLNKQIVLVPNTAWSAATDPVAKQLVSKIVVNLNVNADDIDNRLMANDLDVDMAGTGVQAAARAKILGSATLKQQADDPISGFLWFYYINTKVPPLNNVACRQAVEYAANKTDLQTAYGGPIAGGAIGSTVAPPTLLGYKAFDLYEATSKPSGDLAKAKAALVTCGHPSGFSTSLGYRSDRPKEAAAAQALQQALSQAGIKLQLHGYPSATYYGNFAGVPNYVHQHGLGIDQGGWAPDWPDGYGFFEYIAGGNSISPAGNTNVEELNDPVVNGLLAKFGTTTDAATRNSYTAQIDMEVMKQAVMLPIVYAKSLLYRNPNLTNVYVQQYYGMYNYAVLGLK